MVDEVSEQVTEAEPGPLSSYYDARGSLSLSYTPGRNPLESSHSTSYLSLLFIESSSPQLSFLLSKTSDLINFENSRLCPLT